MVRGQFLQIVQRQSIVASGLLGGRMTKQTQFSADDHRNFNRHGESFDVGETFAGVDFATGLEAVSRLRPLVPEGVPMARFARPADVAAVIAFLADSQSSATSATSCRRWPGRSGWRSASTRPRSSSRRPRRTS